MGRTSSQRDVLAVRSDAISFRGDFADVDRPCQATKLFHPSLEYNSQNPQLFPSKDVAVDDRVRSLWTVVC
jgi:hypothetical protein